MLSSSDLCILCPRECKVNRINHLGYCKSGKNIKVARAALHFWEEPCISGTKGSGTVFFSGCTMRCCFCQNYNISSLRYGKEISSERLSEIFLELQEQGAHNINLVTATHYLHQVLKALDKVKDKLAIPVVFNCGGYEKVETIKALKGHVDIYLPDLKYFSNVLAMKLSRAPDYFQFASKAIREMVSQTGKIELNKEGIMKKGVIIRHLVLPGQRSDSIDILHWISENLDKNEYILSLMSQYTPIEGLLLEHKELNRKITTFEYESVVEEAMKIGLSNYFTQEKSSAKDSYTPPFNLEGV